MDVFQFTPELNSYFGASTGAGSRVTEKDEAKKRQLTATKSAERPIIEAVYPNIPTGKKEQLGDQCIFNFRLFPTGQIIKLPLLFRPKDNDGTPRDELRLYMNKGVFFPEANIFWFVYVKAGELWIGALTDQELNEIRNGKHFDPFDGNQEISEEEFQSAVTASKEPKLVSTLTTAYQRNPAVAYNAIQKSGYACEMLPNQPTFVSKSTGKIYLEAHHLVPMYWQRHIPKTIDVPDNICVLNPYAHKMIHHAKFDLIKPHIEKMAKRRSTFLKSIDMSVPKVLDIYEGLSK